MTTKAAKKSDEQKFLDEYRAGDFLARRSPSTS